MTARDLLEQALKQIGAVQSTAPMRDSEAADGLIALQGFLNALRVQELAVPTVSRTLYTVTLNQATYTLGPTQVAPQWTGARPSTYDVTAGLVDSSGYEYPLQALTRAAWPRITDKAATGWPSSFYLELGPATATITLYPVPSDATIASVALYVPVPLTDAVTLDTILVLPDGAYESLLYGLALRCVPPYGAQLDPTIARLADEALGTWKRAHMREVLLALDPALTQFSGGFDIRTGQ